MKHPIRFWTSFLAASLAAGAVFYGTFSAAQSDSPALAPGPVCITLTSAANRKPVPGVVVQVGGRYANSDGNGLATLDGVPAGAYKLLIVQNGFDRFEQAVNLPAGKRLPLAVTLTPTSIVAVSGVVTLEGDGRPLAGATIAMIPLAVPASVQGRYDFLTDWAGKFSILEIPAGKYRVELKADGCANKAMDVEIKPGIKPLEWTLARVVETASLKVIARDSLSNQTLAGAKVVLAEAWPKGVIASATADASGTVVFQNLKVARLNWMDEKDNLAVCRRQATVRVEAADHEPAIFPVAIGGSAVNVLLNPTAKIVENGTCTALAAAQAIVTGAPVEFKIDKVGKNCFFTFRLKFPSFVRVKVGPKNPLTTIAALMDAKGKQVDYRITNANDDNVMEFNLAAGEYHLRVGQYGDSAMSEQAMTLLVSQETAADPFEPNGSIGLARLIRSGEEVRGCIFPVGDVDYFRFETTRPGQVRFTCGPYPLVRQIVIQDEKGKDITNGIANPQLPLEVYCQLAPGRYFVVIHHYGDSVASLVPYTLKMEAIGDDGIDDPPEQPGRLSAVRTIGINQLVGSTTFPVGDVDRYNICVPTSGVLHARLIQPITSLLQLRNARGQVLTSCISNPNLAGEIAFHFDAPQTVILETRQYGDSVCATGPYILSTWWEPSDELDAMGRNDTFESAWPLELGDWMRGTILPVRDVDMYRVEVDHPGYLHVKGTMPAMTSLMQIYDSKKKLVCNQIANAGCINELGPAVLPGEYYIELRQYGDSVASSIPYAFQACLERVDPLKHVPLNDNPPLPMKLGEAQPLGIEHVSQVCKYVFQTPAAGKVTLRWRSPLTTCYVITDDLSGAKVTDGICNGNVDCRLDLEPKGPARYLVTMRQYGDSQASMEPGFILADVQGRDIVAERLLASADPYDPTLVTFSRTELKPYPGGGKLTVDPDSSGKDALDVPPNASAAWRYKSQGVYAATAHLAGANGTTTVIRIWAVAVGTQERKGVRVLVNFPGEGQVVDRDEACRVNAISYSSGRIARVSAAVDGRAVGTAYTLPYTIDVPWGSLGAGNHALTVTAVDTKGGAATVRRAFGVSDYFDLLPADGATMTGNNIAVSWVGRSFGPAAVKYRARGEAAWKEAVGESGTRRRVALGDLEAGKAYEFQPVGGAEAGPIRTVTRVKGLAFGKAKYAGTINRDYDQHLGVSVRNNGDKPLTVRLECGKLPEESKLLVGFVGEGSQGAPVNLGPGEDRDFLLGLSAQDVIAPTHKFPIRLASDSGFADEAEVDVSVKLPTVKLEWEEAGPDPSGFGKIFRLHNKGDTVTDLSAAANGGDMYLSPSVQHGLFQAGASMEFTAIPRLYESYSKAEAKLTAGAVGKQLDTQAKVGLKEGQKIFGVQLVPGLGGKAASAEQDILTARTLAGAYLNPAYVDWSSRPNPQDTDGDGKPDRWSFFDAKENIFWVGDSTHGDGEIDFVHADIGNDGQFDYSAFKTKDGWEPTNLVEAYLEMGFSLPWARSAYEKHDVDIVMNGKVIGKLRDMIPEGNYTFKIPPGIINFNEAGVPANNDVEIQSKHLRGGHYVVSSDFRIKVRMTGTRQWVISDSQENAEKSLKSAPGLSTDGPDYSVSSTEIVLDGQLAKGQDVFVTVPLRNVGATRTKGVTVALQRATPGGAGVELTRQYVQDVPLTGETIVRLPWKAACGTHTLRVVVDPDKESGDMNPDNNVAMISFTIPGETVKPTLKLLEPAPDAALKDTIVPVSAQAVTDGGAAKMEVKVDGGLYGDLSPVDGQNYRGSCLVQGGPHTITVRVTDNAGNQVEQAVKVSVQAPTADVQIVDPPEAASLAQRQATVKIKAGPEAQAAAVRVNGGQWVSVPLAGGEGQAAVPLAFGACKIEAMCATARGAQSMASRTVTCTAQKTKDDPETLPEPPKDAGGKLHVDGVGEIDPLGPPNGPIKPSAGDAKSVKPATGDNPPTGNNPQPATKPASGDDTTGPGGEAKGADGGTHVDPATADVPPADAPATNAQPDTLPPVLDDTKPANDPNKPANNPNTQPADQPQVNVPPLPIAAPLPPGPIRPAGGFVTCQAKQSDWYCTNRPNIKVSFQLPDWLKRKNLTYADKQQYDAMVKKMLDQLKARGIKTDSLEKFQDALRRRIRGLNTPGELPSFLESIGFEKPKSDDPAELARWRAKMEQAADAWYLRLLASGDPQLIAEGLKARAEAIGQFDKAMQDYADASIEQIHANQKLVQDVADSLPVVGDVTNVWAAITGEAPLTGEQLSALDRALRLGFVLGPLGIEQLLKYSPNARLVMEGLGEMGESMGQSGKSMLARMLGQEPAQIDKSLQAIGAWLTKERTLIGETAEDRLAREAAAFAKTPEGLAEAARLAEDKKAAEALIDRLKNCQDPDEFKQLALELQSNKTAQSLANSKAVSDELRTKLNGEMKGIYKETDAGTKADLESLYKKNYPGGKEEFDNAAKALGMDPEAAMNFRNKVIQAAHDRQVSLDKLYKAGASEEEIAQAAKELGMTSDEAKTMLKEHPEVPRAIDDIEVDTLTITNSRPPKPGETPPVSYGRDRDVTYVIKTKDKQITYPGTGEKVTQPGKYLGDVDHTISTGPYEQNFWKATNKGEIPRLPDGSIDHAAVAAHADTMDQCVTSKWHNEAYNTGPVQLNDFLNKSKQPTLTRIEDIRDTVTFKSEHWFGKADESLKLKDPVMASRQTAEGMRQATKQWDDLVVSRMKQYGLDPSVNVPPRLKESMDIFRQVKDGKITTGQAEAMLASIGTSKATAVKDMGSFLEGMEKTTGVGWRRVQTAQLVQDLHKLPSGAGGTQQALEMINNALSRGHVTGTQFQTLRTAAIGGYLKDVQAAMPSTWKDTVKTWAAGALNRRLICQAEKEALDKQTQ